MIKAIFKNGDSVESLELVERKKRKLVKPLEVDPAVSAAGQRKDIHVGPPVGHDITP